MFGYRVGSMVYPLSTRVVGLEKYKKVIFLFFLIPRLWVGGGYPLSIPLWPPILKGFPIIRLEIIPPWVSEYRSFQLIFKKKVFFICTDKKNFDLESTILRYPRYTFSNPTIGKCLGRGLVKGIPTEYLPESES